MFFRRKAEPTSTDAEPVVLEPATDPTRAVSPIKDWDLLIPSEPSSQLPNEAALRAWVDDLVAEHARGGSIDSAHGALLDRLIHEEFVRTHTRIEECATRAKTILARIQSQGLEHYLRLASRVAELRVTKHNLEQARATAYFDCTGESWISEVPTATSVPPMPVPALPVTPLAEPTEPPLPSDDDHTATGPEVTPLTPVEPLADPDDDLPFSATA